MLIFLTAFVIKYIKNKNNFYYNKYIRNGYKSTRDYVSISPRPYRGTKKNKNLACHQLNGEYCEVKY